MKAVAEVLPARQWLPEEDACLLHEAQPEGRSEEECYIRKAFLVGHDGLAPPSEMMRKDSEEEEEDELPDDEKHSGSFDDANVPHFIRDGSWELVEEARSFPGIVHGVMNI